MRRTPFSCSRSSRKSAVVCFIAFLSVASVERRRSRYERDRDRRRLRSRRAHARRALFVHGARCDLLGALLRAPLIELALLDVLVLTGALRALLDPTRRH